jgi:hypothetical protein
LPSGSQGSRLGHHFHNWYNAIPWYVGSFNTNYIIYRNIEFCKNILLKEEFYLKEIRESFEIFRNVLDFYMQFSDLVHYSTGMC